MTKKGDLDIHYLVLFIIGLVVLIVVLLIFSTNVKDFAGKIASIMKEIWEAKPPIEDIVK